MPSRTDGDGDGGAAVLAEKLNNLSLKQPAAEMAPQAVDGGASLLALQLGALTLQPKLSRKQARRERLLRRWDEYFGGGDLCDWQRLCRDLNLPDDLPSKTKCRKAIETVHVNICQFLSAENKPEDVIFFASHTQLVRYTSKGRTFPLTELAKGDPLRSLLRPVPMRTEWLGM